MVVVVVGVGVRGGGRGLSFFSLCARGRGMFSCWVLFPAEAEQKGLAISMLEWSDC